MATLPVPSSRTMPPTGCRSAERHPAGRRGAGCGEGRGSRSCP
ncbi:hypothetical protein ACFPM0_11120 [Pseudonocardia sulfidoxydans]